MATPGGPPLDEHSPGSKRGLFAQAVDASLPGQLVDAVSATRTS